ncbi:MAG: MATE family efflux transporter [Clostridia bacterium]|nr:MATE family efflux transporter [Clostridia bacterium]
MKEQKESIMATEKVSRLIVVTGVPMILSMVLQGFYNIVDSAFVSNMREYGEEAINALTLAFPVQILMASVAIGTGIGVNVLLSKSLGQKNFEKANGAVGNAVVLSVIMTCIFMLFGVFGVRGYIASQTSSALITEMGTKYLSVCCVFSAGIVFFGTFEKTLQATGRSLFSTAAQVIGAVTNIVLDPILIYGLLGCPEMGVSGAAWATVIGQFASAAAAIIFHILKNAEIENKARYLRPRADIIKEIYAIGLPAIIAQALLSVMTYMLNLIFVRIDEAVVTAFGLYFKVQQFVLFICFGLRDAVTPIISFNYGMRSKPRIKDGIKYGMIYTLVLMAAALLAIEAFARPFAGVFALTAATEALCIDAMRIVSVSFIFAGISITYQGVFQSLGSGVSALASATLRQIIFIIPLELLFSHIAMTNASLTWLVWLAFPIAEAAAAAVTYCLMRRIDKKKIAPMEEGV